MISRDRDLVDVRFEVVSVPLRRQPITDAIRGQVDTSVSEIGPGTGVFGVSSRQNMRVRILNDFGISVERKRVGEIRDELSYEAETLLEAFDVVWSGMSVYISSNTGNQGPRYFGIGSLLPDTDGEDDLTYFRNDTIDLLAGLTNHKVDVRRPRQPDLGIVTGHSDDSRALESVLSGVIGAVQLPVQIRMAGEMTVTPDLRSGYEAFTLR